MQKTALITGITGQDGAYLAELLLEKGYTVHGIKRRSSSFNTGRIDHLYQDPHDRDVKLHLHYGDMTDSTNLIRIMQETQPDEIKLGLQDKLYLGNLDAERDWGHAKDYVRGMWLMLQQDKADDYVLATGKTTSVRDFVNWSFSEVDIALDWQGSGVDEKGIDAATGKVVVEIDPRYFRPTEVDLLLGDATKAFERLGWKHDRSVRDLISEMVTSDLREMKP